MLPQPPRRVFTKFDGLALAHLLALFLLFLVLLFVLF
jgi:hypothetical protein